MDKSPLTQQPRPEAFQQKIVQLYEDLFKVCTPPTRLQHFHPPTPSVVGLQANVCLTCDHRFEDTHNVPLAYYNNRTP